MKHSTANKQQATYIVARYIRAGLEGAQLRRRVERHAGMLRGTEPELAAALEDVGLSEVRRLVESSFKARRDHRRFRPMRFLNADEHRAKVIAGICSAEES